MSLLPTRPYRIEDIGPIYSIILGSPASGQIFDEYRQQAAQLANAFCQDGAGVLRPSSNDPTPMIYSRVIPIK